ncbi:23S rRNA (guanosine2251-2'-O)-methyltransferase [Metamycoplasma subdolum]|uniref:23S rRNA (Guanosine2251-2'-O)-methyltransferase n=1 Tax=Metamycoplasma subdolum TaxID=92407 RepID=A0A3M0A317_9BACT|nr:23S rRNA (guanosine(2251)-2'-O)-methyltransferase RlmB [Metamycoplasma subdolum]RMA79037.1 23S rRNA (guanosine2251-2'-O)-methyltransferase [Metamycoplasma subdolum]WPB50560.1 23S rRNA (guanosine(2251)-2'-O)-methyltransferase RlmB [Metamycoplasma subdolum]
MKNIIYGKNSVLDAVSNNFPIEKLMIDRNLKDKTNIKFNNISYVSRFELDKLCEGNHQGFVAIIKDFQYHDLGSIFKDKPNFVLMLDHIQDPQNFGSIIRTCNAFNIKHIIIPKNRAVDVTPTVLKVSSGGFNNVKIIKVASLFDATNDLKKNNFWIYATALDKNAKKLHQVTFASPTCLIVGNEETGVSKTLINNSDEVVFIEQNGIVQSLNVSAATAILVYELTKEKK